MTKNKKLTIEVYTDDILQWIDDNLNEQPRLEDLSIKIGYSTRTIQMHFKKKHGISIGHYIYNRRLYRACVWLRMTELSISEIAHYLSFVNHQNFCRAFKKKLGCSPRTFRHLPISSLPSINLPKTNFNECISHSILTLKNKVLLGKPFNYKDKFTDPNSIGSSVRLHKLQAWFQENQSTVAIASDIERTRDSFDARKEMISVSAIIGEILSTVEYRDTPENMVMYRLDGHYLCCSFHGFFSDYSDHNKAIYMHLLPNLGLKRREGPDVEFFYFTPHIFDEFPKVCCEHYIPIENSYESPPVP